jgi:signal transduction histidine kinase
MDQSDSTKVSPHPEWDAIARAAQLGAVGQMVPIVAHEINNPLSLIVNNLYLLEREIATLNGIVAQYQQADPALAQKLSGTLPQPLGTSARLLDRARAGVSRIQELSRDLLDFSRTAQGLIDVNEGIEVVLRIVHRRAEKQGVTVKTEFAALPPLSCCPRRIKIIALNLVLNAIEASGSGNVVTVRTSAADGGVTLEVLDTGHGIDPGERERVFEPFFTTRPSGQNPGLGLTIVRWLIAELGGRLDLASTPGAGTQVHVWLPCGGS